MRDSFLQISTNVQEIRAVSRMPNVPTLWDPINAAAKMMLSALVCPCSMLWSQRCGVGSFELTVLNPSFLGGSGGGIWFECPINSTPFSISNCWIDKPQLYWYMQLSYALILSDSIGSLYFQRMVSRKRPHIWVVKLVCFESISMSIDAPRVNEVN